MFKEFGVVLCVAAFVCATPIQPRGSNTGPVQFIRPNSERSNGEEGRRSASVHSQGYQASRSGESNQNQAASSTRYLPAQQSSYQVNSAVVETIAESATQKTVPVQLYRVNNENQQRLIFTASVAEDPSSSEYNNILQRYTAPVQPINPYYAVPVAPKSITIGSQERRTEETGTAQNENLRPVLVYANNVVPVRKYVPIANTNQQANQATESRRTVNVHSASSTRNTGPIRANAENGVTPRPVYEVSLSENTAANQEAAQLSTARIIPIQYIQTVANPQVAQYVPIQRVAYAANPAADTEAAKKVTVESYNSVIAHPPSATRNEAGSGFVRYASIPVQVSNPIAIPVIYQANGAQSQQSSEQRYAFVTNNQQESVRSQQATADPDGSNKVQYKLGVPVVHAESFIEKLYAPAGSTPTPTQEKGYSRAVVFAPASEVSRVTFNGLGVSYGW